jgi:primosomal protein N' (replication factor Y)
VGIGHRVIVQFGKKKVLTGIVVTIHEHPPKDREAKYLLDILDHEPVINPLQLALFEWMAKYYMCAQGQVLQVGMPSGLKLSSQSKIQLHPEYDEELGTYPMDESEQLLLEALQKETALDYQSAADILGTKDITRIVKSLLSKNAILLFEEVKEKYQPKKIRRIRLTSNYTSPKALEELFESLQKKPKQTEVILKYLQQVQVLNDPEVNQKGVVKSRFLSDEISASSLKTLTKNQILEEFEVVVSRFDSHDSITVESVDIVLSSYQLEARNAILRGFESHQTVLFHGITGSGKTEIYIDLIHQVLESGSQVLYLLPEIALTTQIVQRLYKIFGDAMGVYHSRFSDNERVEVWRGILEGKFSFIVGVRSAVFLPFDNLGLIIVDEEHENSYKQFDPAPRYHARDVSLVLARFHHAKALLGSATPSVESYHHATTGKYFLVSLAQRFGKVALPEYQLVDTSKAKQKQALNGIFTQELVAALKDTISQNRQAIIFQNRRGYAPYLQCQTCADIPQCPNCSVTLTFHLHYNQLRCHYCGYRQKMMNTCAQCESTDLQLVGYGTEKIEDDLKQMLPEARIQRMDLDTTRRKYGYQKIINQFELGDIDILIGTQMVTKGLDFGKVELVGVLDIDRIMHFPDFRSHERAFQLITQVGGRAGRRSGLGKVMVQTANVKHPLLKLICDHDYQRFFQSEISERAKYHYPPFVRLIRITLKSGDPELTQKAATALARRLVTGLGKDRVLGPQEPVISKLRNMYLMEIYLKLEKGRAAMEKVKNHLAGEILELNATASFRSVRVIPDVDPY